MGRLQVLTSGRCSLELVDYFQEVGLPEKSPLLKKNKKSFPIIKDSNLQDLTGTSKGIWISSETKHHGIR
jgi:hypothetical protein